MTNYYIKREAWECPRCHKINGPHIDQCSCHPIYESYPILPGWEPVPWYKFYWSGPIVFDRVYIITTTTNTDGDQSTFEFWNNTEDEVYNNP